MSPNRNCLLNNLCFFLQYSTDKICAFFLEWRPENTEYNLTFEQAKSKRRFRLLKEDERLCDLIADNLTLNSSSFSLNRTGSRFTSSNRLINKEFFVKDWEVWTDLISLSKNENWKWESYVSLISSELCF